MKTSRYPRDEWIVCLIRIIWSDSISSGYLFPFLLNEFGWLVRESRNFRRYGTEIQSILDNKQIIFKDKPIGASTCICWFIPEGQNIGTSLAVHMEITSSSLMTHKISNESFRAWLARRICMRIRWTCRCVTDNQYWREARRGSIAIFQFLSVRADYSRRLMQLLSDEGHRHVLTLAMT